MVKAPKQIEFDHNVRKFWIPGTSKRIELENAVCIGSEMIQVNSDIVGSHPNELKKQASEVAQSRGADYFSLSRRHDEYSSNGKFNAHVTSIIATLYVDKTL